MKTKTFSFELPEHLIAQIPAEKRTKSRLMVLNREKETITHSHIDQILDFIPENTFMVVNDSKVRKARIYATLDSGIPLELLFLEDEGDSTWTIMSNKTKRLKLGRVIALPGNVRGVIIDSDSEVNRKIRISPEIDEDYFNSYGHVPLPPYIQRDDRLEDIKRYQTVYADKIGSVAAPTAGLHFTKSLLKRIETAGIEISSVTLHVGAGTFLPIRTEHIFDHKMHYETYEISSAAAAVINNSKKAGKKLLAVGTTSVRTLESASLHTGTVNSGKNKTDLFISPGYTFKVVDYLLTNFHTPESTLLILAASFAGYDFIMRAYNEAITNEYRFFSYGDAMLII